MVLFGCQKIDTSQIAVLPLPIVGVVCIVSATPVVERDGTNETGIIPSPGFQKGLVSAIMLDNKDADKEHSGNTCQNYGNQVGPIEAVIHQNTKAHER